LITTRQQEQRDAAQVVGAKNVHFFNYEDGSLEITRELKLKLVQLIREVRPDTVITLDPTMVYIAELGFINHPDHRAAGQATLDAIFPLARDHLSFPELHDGGLKPHKVAHVLLINHEKQNYYVDVSNEFEAKTSALCKHVSQVNDTMLATMTEYAQRMGAEANCAYAEGFMRIDIPA
jgi:LmbE family N-acetylglucosaminyl deacetylase